MKIKLSDDILIDLDKMIESRAIFQANSGGGKSWAGRRFIEQAFGHKQIIIIDPEGEFGNMRQAFDFVYVAKEGGDAPAEVRSAALLARRLLETKANAIIDIYELGSQRGDFVKAFFDACVDMPKNLWQDCFFLLDEAHKFAPEKGQGESVALQSVIDMASLGRKRGYCLIPMTQRPSKLSKDVVAECNNKLIGRASLDIDRERSAKELGFRNKEDILSLRDLEPGEFYVFGPAISRDVVKTKIGDVKIKPPKRGTARSLRIAPPTAKVKKILAELADLPQEAEKEAKTTKELTEALRVAKGRIATLERAQKAPQTPAQPVFDAQRYTNEATKAVERAVAQRDKEWAKVVQGWKYWGEKAYETLRRTYAAASDWEEMGANRPLSEPSAFEGKPLVVTSANIGKIMTDAARKLKDHPAFVELPRTPDESTGDGKPTVGELAILKAIAPYEGGITRPNITLLANYKKSSRDRYINYLQQKGLARVEGDRVLATEEGIAALGDDYSPMPQSPQALRDHFMSTLPEGEKKILYVILSDGGTTSREIITTETGYQKSSRDRYINYLQARELVIAEKGGIVRAAKMLLD